MKKNTLTNTILPLIPMILWGSLFAFVKIGYKAFSINTGNIGDILMFAAVRFFVCGLIGCIIALILGANLEKPVFKSTLNLFCIGIFSVILHYSFIYIGLTMTSGSKAAILKQLGPLLYACFSFLFIKTEKFSIYKIIGAVVGFCGILIINLGGDMGGMSVGDILILLASLCTVISLIMTEKSVNGTSPFWVFGISQLFGGAALFALALIMNGKFPVFTTYSTIVFTYICFASTAAYTLFFYAQKNVPLSRLFVIKFADPFFACIFSAALLNENIFRIQYPIAFILISLGIIMAYNEKQIKEKKIDKSKHSTNKEICGT